VEYRAEPLPSRATGSLRLGFPGAEAGGPVALLSLKDAGDMRFSRSSRNLGRDRFFASEGVDPEAVLGLELAHSRRVIAPASAEEHRGLMEEAASGVGADGILLPSRSGLVATVTIADCMPIWILDRGSGAFGVLHSGWRGTGILEAAATLLASRYGARPEDLRSSSAPR
jgi:copper oxidase (laccase) domain-containing protein